MGSPPENDRTANAVPPAPDADDAEPSSLGSHHLDVLFSVLDWVRDRVDALAD